MARDEGGSAERALVDWAESGLVALTGHPGGPPLVPPGRAATTACELTTRINRSTGARVDLDGARLLAERAAWTGHSRRGRTSPDGSYRLLPTADGWAAVSCARPDDPSAPRRARRNRVAGRPLAHARGLVT